MNSATYDPNTYFIAAPPTQPVDSGASRASTATDGFGQPNSPPSRNQFSGPVLLEKVREEYVETDDVGRTLLHQAACANDVSGMRKLLQQGASIFARSKNGMLPIHEAASRGQCEAVAFLVQQGANVNSKTKNDSTPLHLAVRRSKVQCVRLLLQLGADVRATDRWGETALHWSCNYGHLECIHLLLQCPGVPINDPDNDGKTCLHKCAFKGHTDCVEALLVAGADPTVQDRQGWSPLHEAACKGTVQIVQLLSDRKWFNTGSDGKAARSNRKGSMGGLSGGILDLTGNTGTVSTTPPSDEFGLAGMQNRTFVYVNQKTNKQSTALHLAARGGFHETVAVLLQCGAQVDSYDTWGETALHWSVYNGHVECAKVLLLGGANINAASSDGMTPLHLAARYGKIECVRMLLDRGVNVNIAALNGITPLHEAAGAGHNECVEELIRAGAIVDVIDVESGRTSLHYASFSGHINCLRTLISFRADLNVPSKNGWTALHESATRGQFQCLQILLRVGADPTLVTEKGSMVLHLAARSGNPACVAELLQYTHVIDINARDSWGETPLHWACYAGMANCVQLLLDAHADMYAQSRVGSMPIHLACRYGKFPCLEVLLSRRIDANVPGEDKWTPLHESAARGHVDCVQAVLDYGGNALILDEDQKTALHRAAFHGQIECVKIILQRTKDLGIVDGQGWTVLHEAAACGHEQVMEVLLSMGCDINAITRKGSTPLHFSARCGKLACVKMLLDFNATVDSRDQWQATPLHWASFSGHTDVVNLLASMGGDVNGRDSDRNTPLHKAVYNGHVDCVRALIERGARVDEKGHNGWTPLHEAVARNQVDVVQFLLTMGRASVHAKTEKGSTAMHLAVRAGSVRSLQILCEQGAVVDAKDGWGETPLHWAAYYGQVDEIIPFLLSRGADVNAVDAELSTPLHKASFEGHVASVVALLDANAVIDRADAEKSTALHKAAFNGHVECARVLVERGANVEYPSDCGWTPLHKAVSRGFWEMAEVLLQMGASIRTTDEKKNSVLHLAARCGQAHCVEMLLQESADSEARGENGWTALHEAIANGHQRVGEILVDMNNDLAQIPGDRGVSPLHLAARYGRIDCLRFLLERRVDCDPISDDGLTPLAEALIYGHEACAEVLVQYGANQLRARQAIEAMLADHSSGLAPTIAPSAIQWLANTADLAAAAAAAAAAMAASAARSNAGGHSPVHQNQMHPQGTQTMFVVDSAVQVDMNGDINMFDHQSVASRLHGSSDDDLSMQTPRIAVRPPQQGVNSEISTQTLEDVAGPSPALKNTEKGDPRYWKLMRQASRYAVAANNAGFTGLGLSGLLEGNGSTDDEDDEDDLNADGSSVVTDSPAHLAAREGDLETLQFIMERMGTDVRALGQHGQEIVHDAALSGNPDVVKWLLDRGADPTAKDEQGRTVLMYAAESGNAETFDVVSEYIRRAGHKLKGQLRSCDKRGITTLHYAARGGNGKVFDTVLNAGAEVNACDEHLRTPLHEAATNNSPESLRIVESLIAHGAQVDPIDEFGCTPLHMAFRYRNLPVAQYLIQRGAAVNAADNNGVHAVHIATMQDSMDGIQLLSRCNADFGALTRSGSSILHIACRLGFARTADVLIDVYGCDPNVRNPMDGFHPVHEAVQHGHLECLRVLMKHNAQFNVAENDGHTALHFVPLLPEQIKKDRVRSNTPFGAGGIGVPTLPSLVAAPPAVRGTTTLRPVTVDSASLSGVGAAGLGIGHATTQQQSSETVGGVGIRNPPPHPIPSTAVVSGTIQPIGSVLPSMAINGMVGNSGARMQGNGEHSIPISPRAFQPSGADSGGTEDSLAIAEDCLHFLVDRGVDRNAVDKEGNTALHFAAAEGHVSLVKILCQENERYRGRSPERRSAPSSRSSSPNQHSPGATGNLNQLKNSTANAKLSNLLMNLETVNDEGWTALLEAVANGRIMTLQYLIDQVGANLHVTASDSGNGLHLSARAGHSDIIVELCKRGVDPDHQDEAGWTPLHEACARGYADCVRELLFYSAKPDIGNAEEATPFHVAALFNQIECLRMLWEHDPDLVNRPNVDGATALMITSREGHHQSTQYLLSLNNVAIRRQSRNGWTALHEASHNGHLECMRLLLEQDGSLLDMRSRAGNTPLMCALKGNQQHAFEWLLQRGARINEPGRDGNALLHVLAMNSGNVDMARALMERGANVQQLNREGRNPLHLAAMSGAVDLMVLFMQFNCPVNVKDNDGATALHLAVVNNHESAVRVLLDTLRGSAPPVPVGTRRSPTMASNQYGNRYNDDVGNGEQSDLYFDDDRGDNEVPFAPSVASGRPSSGTDDTSGNRGRRIGGFLRGPRASARVAPNRVNVVDANAKDDRGYSPLFVAAVENYPKIIEMLLSSGADRLAKSNHGLTPIHACSKKGNLTSLKTLMPSADDTRIKDREGNSALHYAAFEGHLKCVAYLVDRGADILAMNNQGALPLHLAAMEGHEPVVRILVETYPSVEDHIDRLDNNGYAPSHMALHENHREVIRLLDKYGSRAMLMRDTVAAINESIRTAEQLRGRAADRIRQMMRMPSRAVGIPTDLVSDDHEEEEEHANDGTRRDENSSHRPLYAVPSYLRQPTESSVPGRQGRNSLSSQSEALPGRAQPPPRKAVPSGPPVSGASTSQPKRKASPGKQGKVDPHSKMLREKSVIQLILDETESQYGPNNNPSDDYGDTDDFVVENKDRLWLADVSRLPPDGNAGAGPSSNRSNAVVDGVHVPSRRSPTKSSNAGAAGSDSYGQDVPQKSSGRRSNRVGPWPDEAAPAAADFPSIRRDRTEDQDRDDSNRLQQSGKKKTFSSLFSKFRRRSTSVDVQ